MIEHFPENYELIWLFESEPEVLDPEEPWMYNTITFSTCRNGIDIKCSILPSYGDLSLRVTCEGIEVVSTDIFRIKRISVLNEKGRETLVAELEENTGLKTFELQLKPHIHVSWEMKCCR